MSAVYLAVLYPRCQSSFCTSLPWSGVAGRPALAESSPPIGPVSATRCASRRSCGHGSGARVYRESSETAGTWKRPSRTLP